MGTHKDLGISFYFVQYFLFSFPESFLPFSASPSYPPARLLLFDPSTFFPSPDSFCPRIICPSCMEPARLGPVVQYRTCALWKFLNHFPLSPPPHTISFALFLATPICLPLPASFSPFHLPSNLPFICSLLPAIFVYFKYATFIIRT